VIDLTVDPTVTIEGEVRTMLSIKILGSGCASCQRLYDAAVQAAQFLGIETNIQKVTDITEIMKYRVMSTPALVINEKVVSAGRVLNQSELTTLLTTALSDAPSV
jgi:small redox-active disulfide protein 2